MRKVSFLTLYMTDSVGNVFILFLRLQYRILGWKGLSIRVFAPLSSSCSMAIRSSTSIPIPVPFSVTGLGSCLHPDGGETSQAFLGVRKCSLLRDSCNLATQGLLLNGIFFNYFLGNFLSSMFLSPLSLALQLFRNLASWLVSLIFTPFCEISHLFVFLLYCLGTSLHFVFQTFYFFFISTHTFLFSKALLLNVSLNSSLFLFDRA